MPHCHSLSTDTEPILTYSRSSLGVASSPFATRRSRSVKRRGSTSTLSESTTSSSTSNKTETSDISSALSSPEHFCGSSFDDSSHSCSPPSDIQNGSFTSGFSHEHLDPFSASFSGPLSPSDDVFTNDTDYVSSPKSICCSLCR